MGRKVLLIEPNYKNKYPPIGLMKLSTYHKKVGDEVTFYKGDPKQFTLEKIYSELLKKLVKSDESICWSEHRALILNFIKKGQSRDYENLQIISKSHLSYENLKYFRNYYYNKKYFDFPEWDRICITTLFTFYWKETISTINYFKKLCKNIEEVKIGGISASVVPEEIEKETGIKSFVGLLNKGGELDKENDIIIDNLSLDYSILDEIDYVYPEHDAYYGYATRGCVNKCDFCVVPKIEPEYNNYISVKYQVKSVKEFFGEKRNLLLLDNNILASKEFNKIINEIKECGFGKDEKYIAPNKYDLAIKGLNSNYNDIGYMKSIIKQYRELTHRQTEKVKIEMFEKLKKNQLLEFFTAEKEKILELDEFFEPYFKKMYYNKPKNRYVDFNQGIDARLLTKEKMQKLSEIAIRPLRIAFDDLKMKDIYEKAVRIAVDNGITNMSNYLLYNYKDRPIDLYYRMKLNIELCEELRVNIYSFPMKYHPIQNSVYFKDRSYLGKYWNRKFIRAIQAILNSTKGKVGRGKLFFEEAFGEDEEKFKKLLYMPEAMIVYREHFKNNGMTNLWWKEFNELTLNKKMILKEIIQINDFKNIENYNVDNEILNILKYYTIQKE